MADEEQFAEYPGSLLACERAVIRRDLRVGLITSADGGPYPFPSGVQQIYSAYGPIAGPVPLVIDASNLLVSIQLDGIANPIVQVGQRCIVSGLLTVEWQTNPAAVQQTQVLGALHLDGVDVNTGTRLMWIISQPSARTDNGLVGQFGSMTMSVMGEFDGDGLPHELRLYAVPNNAGLTYQLNPSASPNVALRAQVITP